MKKIRYTRPDHYLYQIKKLFLIYLRLKKIIFRNKGPHVIVQVILHHQTSWALKIGNRIWENQISTLQHVGLQPITVRDSDCDITFHIYNVAGTE